MNRLTLHRGDDERDSIPFPGLKRRPVRRSDSDETPPTTDAIRRVEDAMHDAQLKFDRLRRMLGYTDAGDDRPRAA